MQHLKDAYFFITPLMILLLLIISFLKDEIILILFSKEFLLAADLLLIILVAESIRMLGLICANLLVAKKWLISNIINEMVLYSVFILAGMYFYEEQQLFGILYGYLLGAIMYLLRNVYCCLRIISSDISVLK